jgi:hypothetical protein
LEQKQQGVAEDEKPGVCAGMGRIGSHSLGEFPSDIVRIDCERCGRAGSYRRDGLVARFGADIALPNLLVALRSTA